jgi:hypothetical protein
MGPETVYAVPLAPVICVVLAAALGPVGAAAPGVADDVTDVVAGVVVSPDLVAWVHPAPISANPVIAAENTAVRFVIARITSPVELDRTSTPTHPNGDAMRVRNRPATNHTTLAEPEHQTNTQRSSKANIGRRQRTTTPGHRSWRDRVLRDADYECDVRYAGICEGTATVLDHHIGVNMIDTFIEGVVPDGSPNDRVQPDTAGVHGGRGVRRRQRAPAALAERPGAAGVHASRFTHRWPLPFAH